MNPVRQAIFGVLNGDATLKALLSTPTAIYHRVVPQNATLPAVVFSRMAGTPEWAFDSSGLQNDVWLVKGVAKGATSSPAEDIDARVKALLTDASFTITGRVLNGIYPELDIDYEEVTAGEVYHHVGSQYRVVSEPA